MNTNVKSRNYLQEKMPETRITHTFRDNKGNVKRTTVEGYNVAKLADGTGISTQGSSNTR